MADTAVNENMMTALFRDRDDAEDAYKELLDRGYERDDISILMSDETRDTYENTKGGSELGNKAAEGTGVGAAVGGTLGAVIGAIAAIGTNLILPGLGLVIAGPLAAALAGAGAGGTAGGLVGALIGSGIPEETAREYESGIREGGIVLGFKPRTTTEASEVADVWSKHNGQQIYR